LKDKGYFTMADGTRSTDIEDAGKKKKAKSETKPGKKRTSAMEKSKKGATAKGEKTDPKKAKKQQKQDDDENDDDLDIEAEGSSPIEESD
jgi:hypothetical protein